MTNRDEQRDDRDIVRSIDDLTAAVVRNTAAINDSSLMALVGVEGFHSDQTIKDESQFDEAISAAVDRAVSRHRHNVARTKAKSNR